MPDPTPPKVLCVDDFPDAAEALAALLTALGFETRSALSGPAALVAAAEFRPDVCLLDLQMPVMDGYELARRLRELLGPGPTLLAITGHHRPDREERARAAGFDRVFDKPPDPAALLAAMSRPAGPG